MSMRVQSALLLALSFGCGKSAHAPEPGGAPASERAEGEHSPRAPSPGTAHVPPLEKPTASADYDPSPSELPLTEDFAAAAEKRVTPSNYLLELVTIERELDQLAPKPASTKPERELGRAGEASKRPAFVAPTRPASALGVARK